MTWTRCAGIRGSRRCSRRWVRGGSAVDPPARGSTPSTASCRPPVGDDHAAVALQPVAEREVELPPVDVADAVRPPRSHHQCAGGVVPDLLHVLGRLGQPQVGVGLPARGDGVLHLAVDPHPRRRDPQALGDARRVVVGGMGRLDRLAEAQPRGGVEVADPHGDGRAVAVHGPLLRAVPADRREDGARAALEPSSAGPQVGTAQRRQLDPPVDDQRQRDGVVLPAQEALGAVDGVEGPEARRVVAGPRRGRSRCRRRRASRRAVGRARGPPLGPVAPRCRARAGRPPPPRRSPGRRERLRPGPGTPAPGCRSRPR